MTQHGGQAVERAAAVLEAKYNTDTSNPRLGFVRLTGLAHLDERTAFREIARQLCRCLLVPI